MVQRSTMDRYVALLGGINVGGHRVKMSDLRSLFETMGFDGVETFIASGNVIFGSAVRDTDALERQIEHHLHDALGYKVPTFIRSWEELNAVADFQPFPKLDGNPDSSGRTLSVKDLGVFGRLVTLGEDDFHAARDSSQCEHGPKACREDPKARGMPREDRMPTGSNLPRRPISRYESMGFVVTGEWEPLREGSDLKGFAMVLEVIGG